MDLVYHLIIVSTIFVITFTCFTYQLFWGKLQTRVRSEELESNQAGKNEQQLQQQEQS